MGNDVKKILVKFPRDINSIIECLPFIVTVSEEFPKAELNIIVEENCSNLLAFLPFKVRVFERPKTKLSMIETHHFCANLHDIFNIDLFLDLENTINSAFLGFNFRATERVGFEIKWNKYFLTKKMPMPLNSSMEQKSMKLLEFYLGKSLKEIRISKYKENGNVVENIEQLFKAPEPPKFIMILVDNFLNVSKEVELWKKFFDSFHNQKFIIWSMEDEEIISDLFSSIDLGHNELYIQKGYNIKEMLYLFSKVKGVITNNIACEALVNYMGLDYLAFFNHKKNWPKYEYFRYRPQRMHFKEDGSIDYYFYEEMRTLHEMNQVVDQIHMNFKL